jgi:multidrug efflux pump subunit AcrA (membrane-fusion protein)
VELARARARVDPEIDLWRINLDFDEKRKARIRSLYDKNVTSDENKDDADREVELSALKLQQARDLKTIRKHELQRAEEQLKQKIIHSPIDGFVLEKLKMPGEYVEDQAIVRIAKLDPLNVEAIVPIELFGKIPVGMAAEVHPETLAAETRPARVTVVDRTGDAGSGTFGVRLEMPNPAFELPAGLKCDLRFVQNSVAAITKPLSPPGVMVHSAIQRDQGPADQVDEMVDSLSGDVVGEDLAVRDMPARSGTEIKSDSKVDAISISEQEQVLLLASVTGNSSNDGVVGAASMPTRFGSIRMDQVSTGQEDDRATDSIDELSGAGETEDIVNEAAAEISLDDIESDDTYAVAAVAEQAYRIGPIHSESELNRVVDLLQVQDDVTFQVRKEVSEETRNYIVVSPVMSTVEALRALVEEMMQHGISDVAGVWRGEFQNRVSVGVFGKHHSAMLRKNKLSEAGFETEVFERKRKIDSWWVDLLYASSHIDKIGEFQGRLGQHVSMVAIGTQNQQ